MERRDLKKIAISLSYSRWFTNAWFLFWLALKGIDKSKIHILFTHIHVISNLYDFFFLLQNLKENPKTVFVNTMKVNGVQNQIGLHWVSLKKETKWETNKDK